MAWIMSKKPEWMNDPQHSRWNQPITPKQVAYIHSLEDELDMRLTNLTQYTKRDAAHRIEMLKLAIEMRGMTDAFDRLEQTDGLDNC
jgi:nitrogenase molybdenum-iron protein alpha/beta subunit